MAFIIRKDPPPEWNSAPLYLEKQYRLGLAIATEFGPSKDCAKRFENLQETEKIVETMVLGSCKLAIESLTETGSP